MAKHLWAFALLLFSGPVSSQPQPNMLPEWMAGHWSRSDEKGWADEVWMAPRGGIMLGASRSGAGDRLQFWEQMRIMREADGTLAFWAVASDQKPVRFVAIAQGKNSILFANTTHDYPQHIRYWRENADLLAEISLKDGTKRTSFRFTLEGK
jgi:Domain of unknown function (DUF6265)